VSQASTRQVMVVNSLTFKIFNWFRNSDEWSNLARILERIIQELENRLPIPEAFIKDLELWAFTKMIRIIWLLHPHFGVVKISIEAENLWSSPATFVFRICLHWWHSDRHGNMSWTSFSPSRSFHWFVNLNLDRPSAKKFNFWKVIVNFMNLNLYLLIPEQNGRYKNYFWSEIECLAVVLTFILLNAGLLEATVATDCRDLTMRREKAHFISRIMSWLLSFSDSILD
jgi:hypothetical protein